MGVFIKQILDADILNTLTSSFDPGMIQNEKVGKAAREFVKTIKALSLYPSHQELIDRFEILKKNNPSLHAHRTLFLWQMSQAGYQLTSLNLKDVDFLQSNTLKCQASFISVLLDDVCDLGRDKTVFNKCVLALRGKIDSDQTGLYQLIADTWSMVQNELSQTPNYVLLRDMLEKAYQEWIASFEYCLWLYEAPHFEEKWEKRLEIIAHTSLLYMAGLIDLLFVPNLSKQQALAAAQLFLRAQKIVQAANWASTWPRELAQQDFTSGVFSIALENGWVEWNDLKNKPFEEVKQKIQSSPSENYLWDECEKLRVESVEIVQEINLPELSGYVNSLSPILFLFLASKQEFSNYLH